MQFGEAGNWSAMWKTLLDDLFDFWHSYRAYFVLTYLLVFCFVSFRWSRRQKQVTGNISPATEEKTDWLKEDISQIEPLTSSPQPVSHIATTSGGKTRPKTPRVVSGRKPVSQRRSSPTPPRTLKIQPLIFFTSLTGTTKALSEVAELEIKKAASTTQDILPPTVHDLSYVDLDDFFISGPKTARAALDTKYLYILLIPSYDIDSILTNVLEHLKEIHHDFRIDTAPLCGLAGYSVFGVGDKEEWPEGAGFCQQAIELDKWLAKLTGRKRAYPIGFGDVKTNAQAALAEWAIGLSQAMADISQTGSLGEGVPGSGNAVESEDDEVDSGEEFPDNKRAKRQKTEKLVDLEDVGRDKTALVTDFTTHGNAGVQPSLKLMVPKSSPTYAALTKQGYTIIGSHSGVKICRWTKSALRGRGSCYKNSFYGIASHLCMETTPSLSCSNKCVFCWRHGTNPVSTTWRWEVDDPQTIFDGAKAGHYQKIKMMRGVPGVRADRFEEAMRIRHCALSLVGEPIFYPRINEFLSLLHDEHISSFLVCNAQHPQQLSDLSRVTQLYVSIDASNKDSLRKIDRPLHRDFWERFQSCLSILNAKRFVQRTVFRLTLVKGFNMADEVGGYADLIETALPCFVEVKGVTYCGTSTSSAAGLTMQNVPFYSEVCEFVEALNATLAQRNIAALDGGYGYGIAAEHAHSCCILLASKRFLIDHKWHTRIDYDRFFELLAAEKASGTSFGPEDYCRETEDWALWGHGGFDPRDQRVDRKGRPLPVAQN